MTTSDVWFYEEFLPSGIIWSVTMGGRTQTGLITGDPPFGGGRNFTFTEPPGSYSFTVGAVAGYSSQPSSGQINLTFANSGCVSQEIIEFTSNPPENATASPHGFLGFSGSSGYYWIASIVGAVLLGALAYYLSDRKGQISGPRDGLKIQVYNPRAPSGEWINPPPKEMEPKPPDEPT
jgi:hypothetical protein